MMDATSALTSMRTVPLLLLMAAMGAGCITDPLAPAATGAIDARESAGPHAPFVALIDTGINPYHTAFNITDPFWTAPPLEAQAIPDAFRTILENEGLAAWNTLESGQLYWFEGTRVLAISLIGPLTPELEPLRPVFPPDPHLIYDDINHGTATASVIASTAPNAWILMVETDAVYLDALRWVAAQPWIDVISVSRGSLAHLPSNVTSGDDLYAEALRQAVDAGKLVVHSGGNNPDPNLMSKSGAPWVISVGGAEPERGGVVVMTSQPVDVVANFTFHGLARNRDPHETFSAQGTSFGAPLVAGTLAETIHRLRVHHGHAGGLEDGALVKWDGGALTNHDLRWALNMSGRYWTPQDWDPTATQPSIDPLETAYQATAPAAPHVAGTPVGPWMQMGWGYIHAGSAETMADLLTGAAAPPDKTDAAAYLEPLFAARSAVWEAYQSRPVG